MLLQLKDRIAEGGFAHIFTSGTPGRIVKLFLRQEHVHDPAVDSFDHEVISRAVWDAECGAYELLIQHPDLARHAPQFFGRVAVEDVLEESGRSVLQQYVPDCGYEIEHIEGQDTKIGTLPSHVLALIEPIIEKFEEAGVTFTGDASCYLEINPIKIIDFATIDIFADLAVALSKNGRLSDQTRKRWGRP